MADREIAAFGTSLVGHVLVAAFRRQTKILVIGFRDKFGLLQLPSFSMTTEPEAKVCHNKVFRCREFQTLIGLGWSELAVL
jgi:hypothetical protein